MTSAEKTRLESLSKEDFEEENIYSETIRNDLLEDDEITPLEEAFMRGWDEA